jgi:DNA replication protein DnaC
VNDYRSVKTLSAALQLRGVAKNLESILCEADREQPSFADFLLRVLETERTDRAQRRLQRNLAGAHLPTEKHISEFDFDVVQGISRKQVTNLLDYRWIDMHENLVLLGPPGTGKTHLAIALSMEALHAGYTVCFERMSNLVRLLRTSDIHRASNFRVKRIMRSHILVVDEIGYTPIDRSESNLFFNLVSELYERSSIIITSNKPFTEWAEMMGDETIATAMLDRLLHHVHLFSINGDSYRVKPTRTD